MHGARADCAGSPQPGLVAAPLLGSTCQAAVFIMCVVASSQLEAKPAVGDMFIWPSNHCAKANSLIEPNAATPSHIKHATMGRLYAVSSSSHCVIVATDKDLKYLVQQAELLCCSTAAWRHGKLPLQAAGRMGIPGPQCELG